MDHGRFDYLAHDQIDELRNSRGYNRKESKEVSKTRSASMGEDEDKRTLAGESAMDTSVTVTGKRGANRCGGVLNGSPSNSG